jgi:hypothetical protein
MTKDEAILNALRACGSDDKQLADAVLVLGSRVTEKGGAFFYNDRNAAASVGESFAEPASRSCAKMVVPPRVKATSSA